MQLCTIRIQFPQNTEEYENPKQTNLIVVCEINLNHLVLWNDLSILNENIMTNFDQIQKADLLQVMSADQINQLFEKGTPITLNRNFSNGIDYELIAAKMQQTGLSEEVILTIETDKKQAVLQDIILYCKGLNLSLVAFLQDELF